MVKDVTIRRAKIAEREAKLRIDNDEAIVE